MTRYDYILQIVYNKQTMGKRDILGVRTLLKPLPQQIFIYTPFKDFTIHTKTVVKITKFIKTPKNADANFKS